jgi:transcriptional regulator with XRE-family HTH domain
MRYATHMAEDFAAVLEAALVRAGSSQAVLARDVGVARSTVSKWMSGERTPNVPVIHRIADALGVPAPPLLEVAGYADDARRWQVQADAAVDPMTTAKHALGALPLRPAARGALIKLAEELSRDRMDGLDGHIDTAWEYANAPHAAYEPLTAAQWQQRVDSRFRRRLRELLGL